VLGAHLNTAGRLRAEPADIDRALTRVLHDSPLFPELWAQWGADEHAVLRALAEGTPVDPTLQSALRALQDEELTELQDGKPTIAVPLFARWIRTKA
jgi:hypothetical protein